MIPDLGKNAAHILSAYGVTLVLILAIVLESLVRARRGARQLRTEEAMRSREVRAASERERQPPDRNLLPGNNGR